MSCARLLSCRSSTVGSHHSCDFKRSLSLPILPAAGRPFVSSFNQALARQFPSSRCSSCYTRTLNQANVSCRELEQPCADFGRQRCSAGRSTSPWWMCLCTANAALCLSNVRFQSSNPAALKPLPPLARVTCRRWLNRWAVGTAFPRHPASALPWAFASPEWAA